MFRSDLNFLFLFIQCLLVFNANNRKRKLFSVCFALMNWQITPLSRQETYIHTYIHTYL